MLSHSVLPPAFPRAARIAFRLLLFLGGMVCLCLAAIQAFAASQMPYSADGLLHLYRAVAVEHSLRVDHSLWPRFSSGLVYGYGAPLFNFFPPLAYYPTSLLHSLGLSFISAWLLTMSAFTVLAGAGMGLLGRLWTGSALGGWVAAAAYVYSPYLLFDSVARGATAELAALATLPFAFYGVTRLAFAGRRSDFLIALIALSAFIPLHTVITLHGAALLALYCLFLIWRAPVGTGEPRHSRVSVMLRLGLAGALALMLTAFYWLPALAEREAIKLPLIAEQLGHIDVTRHLRSLPAVFASPPTADPTQQNQALPISLGWTQLILATIGLWLSWRGPQRQYRSLMIVLSFAVAVLVFLNTAPSGWLWQNIPLIGFTQFPWRVLGLASLPLALMSAAGARLLWLSLCDGWGRVLVLSGFVAVMLLYALPWTYTLFQADVEADDISHAQGFERESGQLALSSYAEYLPLSADASQLEANRLTRRFDENDAIPRLLPSATLDLLEQEWQGTATALRLLSAEAQTLQFDWLYAPGWVAAIDGEPVDVFPSAPAGLVALEAPAGEFELRLSLEPTAAQALANALSGIGLAAAILAALLWRRPLLADSDPPLGEPAEGRWLLLFAAIGIAVFLLKAFALDAADTPIKRSRFGSVSEAAARANFGDKIDLLAVEAPDGEIKQPAVEFKLYWRLHEQPLAKDYSSLIRMRDPQGLVVAEASAFAPGGLATSNWLPGAYIEDRILLLIPPFTPPLPAAYSFDVGLYDSESLRALSLINAAGDPQDVTYQIAALPYRGRDAATEALPPLPDGGEGLAQLLDAPVLPAEATAGDILRFSWLWRKLRPGASAALAQLTWLTDDGDEVAAAPALPLVKGYSFSAWGVGEANRGHHRLVLPPTLPAGTYGLGIVLLEAGDQPAGDLIQLDGIMMVAVPKREFEAPGYDLASGAEWANGIVLHGYSMSAQGDIDLVWSSAGPLAESLHLFVHALDEEGRIAGQWDGAPVDWTRPTTGWLEGEYVTTRHGFRLPAGEYQLRLGWYAPATGARIGVAGSDALALERMFVIE